MNVLHDLILSTLVEIFIIWGDRVANWLVQQLLFLNSLRTFKNDFAV
jgi:hypothetical protein